MSCSPFSPLKTKNADTFHTLLIFFFLRTKDKVRASLLAVIVSIFILEMQSNLPLAGDCHWLLLRETDPDHGCFGDNQDSVFKRDQPSERKCLHQQSQLSPSFWMGFHVTSKMQRNIKLHNLSSQIKSVSFSSSWLFFCFVLFCFVLLCFLGPYLQYMEIPRPGVESELQLLAYTTTTATQDPSRIYDLHHSSQQRQILNPLSEPRDWTHNFMVPNQIYFCSATRGTPLKLTTVIISHLRSYTQIQWSQELSEQIWTE